MKQSKIVEYSSEEVKRLPSESDWARNAAMTDEEIEAAIASDPDEPVAAGRYLAQRVDREWFDALIDAYYKAIPE